MKRLYLCSVLILVVLVGGCATVPMASPSLDVEAKKFMPESGMANIYILREVALGGGKILFQLTLDGRMVGSLAPLTYHLLSVKPGEHTISVVNVENPEEAQATLTAEQGKNYFYKVSGRIGWSKPRAYIKSIGEEEGRELISDSKRAHTYIYK